jgi:hypothetical protein
MTLPTIEQFTFKGFDVRILKTELGGFLGGIYRDNRYVDSTYEQKTQAAAKREVKNLARDWSIQWD